VKRLAEYRLLEQTSSTEAIIGEIAVPLPDDANRGVAGLLWTLAALVPLSIGAGLIRPSLNSLITQQVSAQEYGRVLGTSTALVSAADAIAPLAGGLLFQQYGATVPFLAGGLLMGALVLVSLRAIKPVQSAAMLE
jgi:MFS family permease